jgi:hypothetical protein
VGVLKHQAIRQGRAFVKHVVPAVMKPARTLWNEVIGFIFLCFGGIFGIQVVRYIYQHDPARAAIAGCCTFLFAWYGISSFLRARKISRS